MSNTILQPVIIAGGYGTRLWPISRQMYPKQFLPLTGGDTLLQQTAIRFRNVSAQAPIVICNEEHRFIAAEQLRQIDCKHNGLILEPFGRNTAPAICLAALRALELNKDALILVSPADHYIADQAGFEESMEAAVANIQPGQLVTFGVRPDKPATGYGYIQSNAVTDGSLNKVEKFVEKPNPDSAKEYLASGNYLWNSGLFLFYARDYLNELQRHQNDIKLTCEEAWNKRTHDLEFIRISQEVFEKCPSNSIDYAIMEHTQNAYVIPLKAKWSDVGGWSALADALPSDDNGNVCTGDVICMDGRNNYVYSEHKLVATLGVNDLVIVDTKDALLVTNKDQAESVKKVIDKIKQSDDRYETVHHRVVYRPWGHYDSMDNGDRFQVKRITVKPGAKLSVQKHRYRAEHWVVVSGTAKVQVDDDIRLLNEDESVYIPIGAVHSLENPGSHPLEIIEVQSGSYLGEDDIVRLEDIYGRS